MAAARISNHDAELSADRSFAAVLILASGLVPAFGKDQCCSVEIVPVEGMREVMRNLPAVKAVIAMKGHLHRTRQCKTPEADNPCAIVGVQMNNRMSLEEFVQSSRRGCKRYG